MKHDTPTADAVAQADFAILRAAINVATRVIDGVRDEQLIEPTPCDEWDVRALINHMTAGAMMFAAAADHGHVPDEVANALSGDVLGDDFRAAWAAASEHETAAFVPLRVLDSTLTLPFAVASGRAALNMATMEVAIHCADLARATQQSIDDQQPFAAVLDLTRASMTDAWRTPGILGPEQPVPPSADAVDQLLAYAGRKV